MNIPFSPPYIDNDVEKEVLDCLNSGWITTGPKVRDLEVLSAKTAGVSKAACVNSWTSGASLVLKWLGVGAGDEVIVPAYTYSATALVVLHAGAKPVMVDVLDDFTVDPDAVAKAISSRTKAVFAVDIAGWPCDYDALINLLSSTSVKAKFTATNEVQSKLGRPLLISDAAHSIGALYKDKPAAAFADITIYSFHAVKNVTSAEGGAICFNLSKPFDNESVYKWFKLNSLNGQTKDAFSKTLGGGWRYDIISQGMKINMPDICAAIALAQLRKYEDTLIRERARIATCYANTFSEKPWAIIPKMISDTRKSCFHLFALRVAGASEQERDEIIEGITENGVSVNVHFIPMPMLTLFRNMGYNITSYPKSYELFANEISLPIYPQMTSQMVNRVIEVVSSAVEKVFSKREVSEKII